jgi:hypothetical protein
VELYLARVWGVANFVEEGKLIQGPRCYVVQANRWTWLTQDVPALGRVPLGSPWPSQ